MELLQIDTLLYSALDKVSAEYDIQAGLPREKAPIIYWLWSVGEGHRALLGTLKREKYFITYRDS